MRLIDADALNKELQRRVGSPTDDKLYEANLVIIEAPTIDAIPVEWLKAHKTISIEDWGEEPVTVGAALMIWQKEQEAQDG